MEGRRLIDELRIMEKGAGEMLDLGHPLLNRITDSFIKAAGVGAAQAVTRHAYAAASAQGEMNGKCFEVLLKNTGKESLQWGLAAGMYSGITYGLKEATGTHDWKSSAVAGAVTGMAMSLTTDNHSNEKLVQSAITGAAISTAANLLSREDKMHKVLLHVCRHCAYQATAREEEGMALVFVCCNPTCGHNWRD